MADKRKILDLPMTPPDCLADILDVARRREEELRLTSALPAEEVREMVPGREYLVQWRHLKRRQRIVLDDFLDNPVMPVLRYHVVTASGGRKQFGPIHHLRAADVAGYEPIIKRA
jgi:hypothetical protein